MDASDSGSTDKSAMKVLTARCYCGSIHYALHLPAESLPLSAYMCHCSRCRYIYGAIAVTHAKMPTNTNLQFIAPSSLDSSTSVYRSQGSLFSHHFCTTCGCHMGGRDEDRWYLSIAILPHDESVFRIDQHCFTASARHGLHEWLPRIDDRIVVIADQDEEVPEPPTYEAALAGTGKRLRAQCHCGGISFTFPQPTRQVFEDPYLNAYVSPVDQTKWKAMTDACNDCRLISGTHLSAWTYVPLRLIEPEIDQNLKHGTMKSYISSPGNVRTFCQVCGATALFWNETRPTNENNNVVNISVGLLRAPEGVSAEEWLTWRTNELGWLEAGCKYAQNVYESINKGHRDWGIRNKGCLVDFKLPKTSGTFEPMHQHRAPDMHASMEKQGLK